MCRHCGPRGGLRCRWRARKTSTQAHCEEALEVARQTGENPFLVPFIVTGEHAAALADRRPETAERWLAARDAAPGQLVGPGGARDRECGGADSTGGRLAGRRP